MCVGKGIYSPLIVPEPTGGLTGHAVRPPDWVGRARIMPYVVELRATRARSINPMAGANP